MNGSASKKLRKEARKQAIELSEKLSDRLFQFIHAKALQATHSEQSENDDKKEFVAAEANYEMGTEDGEIYFARILLREINTLTSSEMDAA